MLMIACALAAALVAVVTPRTGREAVGRRLGDRFVGARSRTTAVRGGASGADVGIGPVDATKRTPSARRLATSVLAGAGLAIVVHQSAGRSYLAVLGATVIGVGWAATTLMRRGRLRRERQARRDRVVGMCDALTAELQSGAPPPAALASVAQDWPELRPVRDTVDLGADVPAVLRDLAHRRGGEPLTAVAAGWEVAVLSGAGLATVLDRIAAMLRDDQDVRREVNASLASPRATALMLAVLPVFALGLGTSIGADPVGVLVGSLPGALCLALGSALAVSGLFWVERIADRAEV